MPAVDLVVDTDLSIDVDDVGALCLAHALADRGEAQLLAMTHDTGLFPHGVRALSAINKFYGRGDLPIGAYVGEVGDPESTHVEPPFLWTRNGRGHYVDELVAQWPQGGSTTGRSVANLPRAVRVLRDALATAADASVVIAAIGFATNLRDLLRSPRDSDGDGLPPGVELVREKVRRLVWMGGRARPVWSIHPPEWNFAACGGEASCGPYSQLGEITNVTLDEWPAAVPISFLGFEAGVEVQTGGFLRDYPDGSSPCADGYRAFCSRMGGWCGLGGRASWDPMAVLYAVRGNSYGRYDIEPGRMMVDPRSGRNTWDHRGGLSRGTGQENLLLSPRWYTNISAEIDRLLYEAPLLQPPSLPPSPPPRPPASPQPLLASPGSPSLASQETDGLMLAKTALTSAFVLLLLLLVLLECALVTVRRPRRPADPTPRDGAASRPRSKAARRTRGDGAPRQKHGRRERPWRTLREDEQELGQEGGYAGADEAGPSAGDS